MADIHSYDFKGKRALIRVDFNVPLDKETLTISILRITAPIAFTIDIAKELSNAGIIEKEKRLRAIVSVARPNSGTVVRSFGGTKTDTWLFYSITLNNNL